MAAASRIRRPAGGRGGRRLLPTLLVLGTLLSGCAEAFEDLEATVRDLLGLGGEEAVEEVADPPAEDDPEPTPDPEDGAEEPDEPEAAPSEAEQLPPALELELPEITLLTPGSGEGPRPVLSWEPVPDAATYLVLLRSEPDGPAVWAWRGEDTEIRVGFVEQPGLGGPEVDEGMVWSVLALDADDLPVAQSGERPIAP